MRYYEVAPTQIIRQNSRTFTYAHETPLERGTLVRVEVGKKNIIGVVVTESQKPQYETKLISTVLEERSLPEAIVSLSFWLSDYYCTHLALVFQMILPRGVHKNRRDRQKNPIRNIRNRTKIVFNKYQSAAINKIDNPDTKTVLLHGVTGSGKTAVYIESAKRTLDRGKSVIVLVPEISLTTQVVDEFSSHFSEVILAHSQQTEAERHAIWRSALYSTQPQVVIGPRSALFLPLNDVGLIIIDEAHEPSFKQEQSPRYSALRAASILAKNHSAKLVIGTATPSTVDYYIAETSNIPIIKMPVTARESTPSNISIVDMTNRQNFKKHRFFSDTLLEKLNDTINSGSQALIFHNRRGSASVTLCDNCGWQATCQRCFIPLALHADKYQLLCHVCGTKEKVPTSCPTCKNSSIIHKGIGTKLIESELVKLFPDAKIARFDGDNNRSDTLNVNYQRLYDGSYDIIIGTQVVAKGLDLPKLKMVGIVQADSGLSLPDFATPERTFQLIAQVVGRVGRNKHDTSVVIQSYQASHHSIVFGISQDYESFYNRTISERKKANFPPFTFLLKLTCVYKNEHTAIKNTQSLAQLLRQKVSKDVQINGPAPAFYERQGDTYRWQLILKSKKRSHLVEALEFLPPAHWQFELDPISLL